MSAPGDLISKLRRTGKVPAGELRAQLDVSRATLMRAVQAEGSAVLTVGRARRTAYAARRLLRGSADPLPVFRVDRAGRGEQVGHLHLAHPDGCVITYDNPIDGLGWPLDADMQDGWFEGIPYPLADLRPQGFLGRAFARENAALLQVGEDPSRWSDDDVLHSISLLGSDLSGDFIIGEAAYRRWADQALHPADQVNATADAITDRQLARSYPAAAEHALQHGVAGSSAGGEFPKFTAVRLLDSEPTHVLVKFSGSDDSPGTQRWSDLLICEALAASAVGTLRGLSGTSTQIHRAGGRTFLEVVRFDRHGARGRSPLCSWAAIDHAWFGLGGRPWPDGAARLLEQGLIDQPTRDAISRLWFFGQLIGNTDMHDGNLSFVPGEDGQSLQLAPVYDMLPMLYAPQRGVELPARDFVPPMPLPAQRELWIEAAQAAVVFWGLASTDKRISAEFRGICERNAELVLQRARQ